MSTSPFLGGDCGFVWTICSFHALLRGGSYSETPSLPHWIRGLFHLHVEPCSAGISQICLCDQPELQQSTYKTGFSLDQHMQFARLWGLLTADFHVEITPVMNMFQRELMKHFPCGFPCLQGGSYGGRYLVSRMFKRIFPQLTWTLVVGLETPLPTTLYPLRHCLQKLTQ